MNEVQILRETKKIMKYGISKEMAKEIVEVAVSVSKHNIENAVDYALTLTYGKDIANFYSKSC